MYRSWCVGDPKAERQSPVALAFLAFIRSERALVARLLSVFREELPLKTATL